MAVGWPVKGCVGQPEGRFAEHPQGPVGRRLITTSRIGAEALAVHDLPPEKPLDDTEVSPFEGDVDILFLALTIQDREVFLVKYGIRAPTNLRFNDAAYVRAVTGDRS